MDLTLILAFLTLGAVVGFIAGMLGLGGGMLFIPFISMLLMARGFPHELVVHMAIATSLATIMFTSISAVRAHHLRGAVAWDIVKKFTPGILLGAWIGPWIGTKMNTVVLASFFTLFVTFSAIQMLMDIKPSPKRELPKEAGLVAVGGFIGILAGLVGAGGAFISVPFMTWCNVNMQRAVATSSALGFPIALAGTLSNIYYGLGTPNLPAGSLGFIYLPALLVISIGSVLTAHLGAHTAHKMPVKRLKKVFALMLFGLAAHMLYGVFAHPA